MKNVLVKGVISALITPMTENGIDYAAFKTLIKAQLDSKVSALVLFGTTGEPLSLLPEEKTKLFYTTKEIVGDRIPVICGISSPVTDFAMKSAECLCKLGADGLLVVSPYYYICYKSGIYLHYKKISRATDLPIIVYNVPARTGLDLTSDKELINAISEIPKVVAIKNAAKTSKDNADFLHNAKIPVYCGNDSFNLESLKNGSYGSISVISDLFPELETAMHDAFRENKDAEYYNEILNNICNAFSGIPNPVAIKYACSIRYGFEPRYRLPLTPPNDEQANRIRRITADIMKITEKIL